MTKNTQKTELTDEQIEQVLFDAMRLYDMLPPSIEEVAALDAELASFDLPFGPSDPDKLLRRLDTVNSTRSIISPPFPPLETSSVRNLSRAAREGGELTPEIEQRMATDKDKILQEKNND